MEGKEKGSFVFGTLSPDSLPTLTLELQIHIRASFLHVPPESLHLPTSPSLFKPWVIFSLRTVARVRVTFKNANQGLERWLRALTAQRS